MYNKALRLQSCGELLAAEDILQTLVEENIPQLEQGGLPKTMSTIKYSCYVNLGAIALKKQKLNVALENYLIVSLFLFFGYTYKSIYNIYFRHLNLTKQM